MSRRKKDPLRPLTDSESVALTQLSRSQAAPAAQVARDTSDRPPPPRWNTPKLTGRVRSRWMRTLGPTDRVVEWYRP